MLEDGKTFAENDALEMGAQHTFETLILVRSLVKQGKNMSA